MTSDRVTSLIWDELVNFPINSPEGMSGAELKGYVEAMKARREGSATVISCDKLNIARRMLKLLRSIEEIGAGGSVSGQAVSVELNRKLGRAEFKLHEDFVNEIKRTPLRGANIKWAWFRGLWGGCGAIYLPKAGYYMSLRLKQNAAGRVMNFLDSVKISAAKRVKGSSVEYIIRDRERIITCLSKMGLVRSSLMLEETAIRRSIKNSANKLVNCDTVNISKSLSAAAEQLELVRRIEERGLWGRLTPPQEELARLRAAHASASLGELGQLLSKPVSKSTVEYRWRKIESIVNLHYNNQGN
ncbi:putative sporulation transcription regulator WhiA [Synergistales bacterium]|nr:putative sporulation transcription regulator WhiA [Synergistales bacterium]